MGTPAIEGINRVRLIGVHTPETKELGCHPQPYGKEASAFTTEQLQGKEVELEFDQDKTDQYDWGWPTCTRPVRICSRRIS